VYVLKREFKFCLNHILRVLFLKDIDVYSKLYIFTCLVFSSPGQRPGELLPSLCVRRRPSVVRRKLSHLNLLLWNPWTKLIKPGRDGPWVGPFQNCVRQTRPPFAPSFVNYKKGCTRLAAASDKVYQLLAHGRWFSPGTPASSTTKTRRHDIAQILLKVALKH